MSGWLIHSRRRVRLVLLLLAVALSLAAGGTASAGTLVLKAVTAWPKGSAENRAFFHFCRLVEAAVARLCPGELAISYVGGPEAVKTPDQVQAVQRGMVDLVFTTSAYYLSLLPEADALKLSDFTPAQERANGAWAFLNDLHETRIGLHYLARLGLGGRFHFFLKQPLRTADLRGLDIRVSPMYLQIVTALGGNPVVIPPTEVYLALERNIVDGFCWPAVGIRDWGWERQVRYILEPGFYQVPNPLLVNLATWKRLPPRLRDLLTEAASEAENQVVAAYDELARQERRLLLTQGLQVIDLPPAEHERFLAIGIEAGWQDVIDKSPEVGPLLRKLLVKPK